MNRIVSISVAVLLSSFSQCRADEVFPVIHNEPIAIQILDGINARPQPRVRVVLVGGYDRTDLEHGLWREEATTDRNGVAHLSNQLRNLPFLRVHILKRHSCQPQNGNAAFSVERIRHDGFSGVNRCGTAVVEDAPGIFTVFVKAKRGARPETDVTPELRQSSQKP